jgi:antitoxin component HigA of HigAB toxin-antitoxin module
MSITLPQTSRDAYLNLVLMFPLRPIRNRSSHEQAKVVLRNLFGKRSAAVRDYKVVLAHLIAEYERSANLRLDTSKITPSEIINHLLEERKMSVSSLARRLKISQSSISDMLNGRRGWSKLAIIRITAFFGLEPRMFLQE